MVDADLFAPSKDGECWVVLHTKPRCEKKLQLLSRTRECRSYLPCIERVHNYGARERQYEVPMFSGYLFACILQEDQVWFQQNPHVANVLVVEGESAFLNMLGAIAKGLEGGLDMEVLPYLQPGKRVLVTGGPLKGLETEITEVLGKDKVILRVEMIQQVVAMEVPASYLKSA